MPFEKFPHPPRYEPLKKALITLLGNDKMYPEMGTVFENHRKSSIQDCERSGQKVIPDRSILIGQKLVENAKIENFKYNILCGQKLIKNAKMVKF